MQLRAAESLVTVNFQVPATGGDFNTTTGAAQAALSVWVAHGIFGTTKARI